MNPYFLHYCILFFLVFTPMVLGDESVQSSSKEKIIAEEKIKLADEYWLKNKPQKALPLYGKLLENLPKEYEPFRSTIIMRLARSQFASGKKAECLETLKLLNELEYVPEHHALAAKELTSVIQTGKNPGYARTPVPPLPEVLLTIEVSPTGKFQTLSSALNEARKTKVQDTTVEIVLAPGIYLQNDALVLDEEDSGLVIRSKDPNNPAVITGGVNLKNWAKVTNVETRNQLPETVRDKVRVCDLKANGIDELGELVFGGSSSQRSIADNVKLNLFSISGLFHYLKAHSIDPLSELVVGWFTHRHVNRRFASFPIPELFYNGKPQPMARWPNDTLTKLPVNSAPAKPDPRFARWAKEKDLWLYGYWHWDWSDAYEKVAGIDATGKISLVPPCNGYGFKRKLGCAVNALCEIDQPGEWHLDTKKNQIHYLPPADFDTNKCILSSFDTIIVAKDCTNLQLRNLKINYVRGNAMSFVNCSRLLLVDVDIENCSGIGLEISGGTEHLIHSCRINSMGKGGIGFSAGDWQNLVPGNSIIENCTISKLSRIDHTYTPAILLEGMGIKVRNNLFANIPSSAIRLEACDTLIELNTFYRCVYESDDQGAIDIYINPLYRGNIIRWNDFDQIINNGARHGAAAVRHDDFICGFMVSENIFRKGSDHGFGAVQYNGGADNYFEGNIIIDWSVAFSGHSLRNARWTDGLTGHNSSRRILEETDWQEEAWQKKYPMVHDLLNGKNNMNYIVDNQRMGTGLWGNVLYAISFANRVGNTNFHGDTLQSVKSVLVPWNKIPVDLIGPYEVSESD